MLTLPTLGPGNRQKISMLLLAPVTGGDRGRPPFGDVGSRRERVQEKFQKFDS